MQRAFGGSVKVLVLQALASRKSSPKELEEIENQVRGLPGVTDCAVIVKKYSESIVHLIAFYVAAELNF